MTDFERFIINTAKEIFGNKVKFFRQRDSKKNTTAWIRFLKKNVDMLCALAFFPVDKNAQYFDDIRGEMPEKLHLVVDYIIILKPLTYFVLKEYRKSIYAIKKMHQIV